MLYNITETKTQPEKFYINYRVGGNAEDNSDQQAQKKDKPWKIKFSLIQAALKIGAQRALAKILENDIAPAIERALCVDPDTPEWVSAIQYSVEIMEEQG